MPEPYNHANALQAHLSGAASDGAYQANPDTSLGGYASSVEVPGLVPSGSFTGVTIDYVASYNDETAGPGTLSAPTTTSLTWTRPGGATPGPAVTISPGIQIMLEDGEDASAYILVTPSVSSVSVGSSNIDLSAPLNSVIGFPDATPAETTSGKVSYRCIFVKNSSVAPLLNLYAYIGMLGTAAVSNASQLGASGAGTVGGAPTAFADWPASGFCRIETSGGTLREIVYYESRTDAALNIFAGAGAHSNGRGVLGTSASAGQNNDVCYPVPGIRIAGETPGTGNVVQLIASETTAPSGRTWKTGINPAGGVNIGTVNSNAEYAIWIEQTIVAKSVAQANVRNVIAYQFSAA